MAQLLLPPGRYDPSQRVLRLLDMPFRFLDWLTPGGQLRCWVKWCLTVAIMIGLPILVFAPIVTFLLRQVAVWMHAVEEACAAILKGVGYLALAAGLVIFVIAGIRSQFGRGR